MKKYLLILLTVFVTNVCNSQTIASYKDTITMELDDAIERVIFPRYIKDGAPDINKDWIKKVYESKEMKSYVRVLMAYQLQSVVDYLKVTETDIQRVEMQYLGMDINKNQFKMYIQLDYLIPKKVSIKNEAETTKPNK